MDQLVQIHNVEAIDTFVELGQIGFDLGLAGIGVDHLLDLRSVELHVADNCQVGSERADDTVGTHNNNALVVQRQAGKDIKDGGLVIEDLCLVLGERCLVCDGRCDVCGELCDVGKDSCLVGRELWLNGGELWLIGGSPIGGELCLIGGELCLIGGELCLVLAGFDLGLEEDCQ